MSVTFEVRRAGHAARLLEFLRRQPHLSLLTEMPGNLGDHLISVGTEDLLATGRLEWTPVPVREVGARDHREETLLVPGSGAFVRLWHEWLPECVIAASEVFERVIVLPSEFDVSIPIVADCLGRPNVFPIAREAWSYRAIKTVSPAALLLDCALYARPLTEHASAAGGQGGTLLALREDEASRLREYGVRPDPLRNRDISLTEKSLDAWISTIASADAIVTDRLHVATASVLLGRRLLYLDPCNRKISTYFEFAFGDEFRDRVESCGVEWLAREGLVVPEGRAA